MYNLSPNETFASESRCTCKHCGHHGYAEWNGHEGIWECENCFEEVEA